MEFLNFLEGLSPWWWVALAFAFGIFEMLTASFVLIWLALASVLMALILTVMPGLSGEWQITLFGVLSIVLTFAGRAVLRRFGDGQPESSTLNQRSGHFVGANASVIKFANGEGTVEIEGMRWRARWDDGNQSKAGDTVEVTKADGMILHVAPVKN